MRFLLTTLALSLAFIGNADAARTKAKFNVPKPAFSAKSFLIADAAGTILKEQSTDTIMPIASISKLMTGLLSAEQDMDEQLFVPKSRTVQSSIPLRVSSLPRKELLTLALVKSDNLAAQILCENLPNCVEAMNAKAAELGMSNTHFAEPTGLSRDNVSTANDLLKLLLVATNNPLINHVSSMREAEIETDKNPIKIRNTNPLTYTMDVVLSKTGYTTPAGGCLVMIINSTVGQRFLILLGSKNAKTRIPDMERLVKSLDTN